MKIAFLGIGLMGLPMSQRLFAAGYELTVWNRSSEKCDPLRDAGASVAETPQAALEGTDLVFLCLTDSSAVQDVWQQIQPAVSKELIFVDCSSIDPLITRAVAAQADELGAHWIDCPVSGGVQGAQAGTLAMMVGGRAEILDRVRPVLSTLASKVTYMGESGSGQYAKICNQMIVSCNALVIAEVVAFAEKTGVDSSKLAQAFEGGFADSKPLQILAPEMSERRFEPVKWHVNTLLKDLSMAITNAEACSADTPMTQLARSLMQSHSDDGFGEHDPSTLVKRYLDI